MTVIGDGKLRACFSRRVLGSRIIWFYTVYLLQEPKCTDRFGWKLF